MALTDHQTADLLWTAGRLELCLFSVSCPDGSDEGFWIRISLWTQNAGNEPCQQKSHVILMQLPGH